MPSKSPVLEPTEALLLSNLGDRIRLARKGLKLSSVVVAERASISRTTLHKVEAGDPSVTIGTVMRVMGLVGISQDLQHVGNSQPHRSLAGIPSSTMP